MMRHKVHPSHENVSCLRTISGLNGSETAAILKNGSHLEIKVANGKYEKHTAQGVNMQFFMLASTLERFSQ